MSDYGSAKEKELADIVLADYARKSSRSSFWDKSLQRIFAIANSKSGKIATFLLASTLVVSGSMFLGVKLFAGSAEKASEIKILTPVDKAIDTIKTPDVVKKTKTIVIPLATQLGVGRISATVSTDGSKDVIVRAKMLNRGKTALKSSVGSMGALVVDGVVTGMLPMPEIASATEKGPASSDLQFRMESCFSGRHSVTVIADATAKLNESSKADNSRSVSLTWQC